MKRAAIRLDRQRSNWRAARLLGGTLAAVCKKAGQQEVAFDMQHFETLLRCPDCKGDLTRDADETLRCPACGYSAALEGGVYNLLPAAERAELYPGDRDDSIDFSLPHHEDKLLEGWYDLEGVFGNKYRWIGAHATARLKPVRPGKQRLRIRGHVHEKSFQQTEPLKLEVSANGHKVVTLQPERTGLFILETDLPDAEEYRIEIQAGPAWMAPPDDRVFTVNLSMIKLIPAE